MKARTQTRQDRSIGRGIVKINQKECLNTCLRLFFLLVRYCLNGSVNTQNLRIWSTERRV